MAAIAKSPSSRPDSKSPESVPAPLIVRGLTHRQPQKPARRWSHLLLLGEGARPCVIASGWGRPTLQCISCHPAASSRSAAIFRRRWRARWLRPCHPWGTFEWSSLPWRRAGKESPRIIAAKPRIHYDRKPAPSMKKLILKNSFSPGDIVMLTAAVRDLHLGYPDQF